MSRLQGKKSGIVLALSVFLGLGVYRFAFYQVPTKVEVVGNGSVRKWAKGPGQVSSRTEVSVSSRISGVVATVYVHEGDHVEEGQLLAQLDERELSAKTLAARSVVATARDNIKVAQAALSRASAALELARSNLRRDEKVFKSGHLSRATFDATSAALEIAKAAEKSAQAALSARKNEQLRTGYEEEHAGTLLTYTKLTSPISGLITKRNLEVGAMVAPSAVLFRVVDDETVCVSTRIDVSQMAGVRVGQPARIRLASGAVAQGTVARVSHESDSVTRDQEVRVLFDEPPKHLTINEEARVEIDLGPSTGVVIDASALFARQGSDYVFVVQAGRIVAVEVKVGAIEAGRARVLEGLVIGDQVVTSPATAKAGRRVKAVLGSS